MKNIAQLLFCALLILTINLYAGDYWIRQDYWIRHDLKMAILRGYLFDVKKILNNNYIDINQQLDGRYHCTFLHYAASTGCTKVVQELIDRGANIHAKNYKGRTPLHCAAAECHLNAAEALLKAGAHVCERDLNDKTPADLALENRNHQGNHHQDVAKLISHYDDSLDIKGAEDLDLG